MTILENNEISSLEGQDWPLLIVQHGDTETHAFGDTSIHWLVCCLG